MKLMRIFGATFVLSCQRDLAFRSNFIFQVLLSATSVGSGLVVLSLVYSQTVTLNGWNRGEAVVLLGTFQFMSGLLATFIEPNVTWFADQVKTGKLDDTLLKPIPGLLFISLGTHAPVRLSEAAIGLLVLVGGLFELHLVPSVLAIATWIFMLAAGSIVMWATRVSLACIALWAPALQLDVVYGAIWQFGRYPVDIYRQPARFILTYFVPIAFIATLPAQTLVRDQNIKPLIMSCIVSTVASFLTYFVWSRGVKRYTGATS